MQNRTAPDFIYRPPNSSLVILHQDDDLLVLDKPCGLLSVPGKTDILKDCLEKRAQAKFQQAQIVHRLDMDTSGVLIFAMNKTAMRHLGLQFERRKLEKHYIARIHGQPHADSGSVDLPLRCDWPNRPLQMVCHEQGRNALTHWEILEREHSACRVKLVPHTGRTHQLRVHMLAIGHPILGDRFYADDDALLAADRLQLHAKSLTLHHPSGGERITFTAPVPF